MYFYIKDIEKKKDGLHNYLDLKLLIEFVSTIAKYFSPTN